MISVVLYGRNDSYGYNLHKRAVLSLNCIAELLDDPDDEILFVDYNTPDDLPTFVEAIGDMLTPSAKKLVRVIRVRPRHHARFGNVAHLKALESPARNAAVRRCNPRNRWLLSTNTDMVFVTAAGRSLSSIAAELPDGFYHTARFELPEVLWETLDRGDPRACMDKIGAWGSRLQLQEVMYGTKVTLFDGPGDFQLMLRSDVFSIDGFDERMLLGWHIDSNIAKRLTLLRGEPVRSALQLVRAFHCDHNRESTPMHAHGAVQNDWQHWVTRMKVPTVEEQRDTWGFNGESLEDFRLDDKADVGAVLASIVPAMPQTFYVAGLELTSDLRYDPEHVIPYLANVIAALPRHWNAFYAGCREKTFSLFARLWSELGFSGTIFLDDRVARVFGPAPTAAVNIVEESRAMREADIFLFEMGLCDDDARGVPVGVRAAPEAGARAMRRHEYERALIVHRAFVRATKSEQEAAGPARRFFLINMQGNPFDSTVASRIAGSWTPQSTRIKHGFVVPDPFRPRETDPGEWLNSKIAGRWKPGVPLIRVLAQKIAGDDDPADWANEWRRGAEELVAILQRSDAPPALRTTPERLQRVVTALKERRLSAVVRNLGVCAVVERPSPERGLTRMFAVEDFEDPEWGRCAVRAVGPGPFLYAANRSREAWNASHLLYALEQLALAQGSCLLLQTPDDELSGFQSVWATLYDWVDGARSFDGTFPFPQTPVYDSIVVAPRFLLMGGQAQIPAVLSRIDAALNTGGACVTFFDLAFEQRSDRMHVRDVSSPLFDDALQSHTAWRPIGRLTVELTEQTIDLLAKPNDPLMKNRRALYGGCLVFQKTGVTDPQRWADLATACFGDRTRAMASSKS